MAAKRQMYRAPCQNDFIGNVFVSQTSDGVTSTPLSSGATATSSGLACSPLLDSEAPFDFEALFAPDFPDFEADLPDLEPDDLPDFEDILPDFEDTLPDLEPDDLPDFEAVDFPDLEPVKLCR